MGINWFFEGSYVSPTFSYLNESKSTNSRFNSSSVARPDIIVTMKQLQTLICMRTRNAQQGSIVEED